MANNPAEYTSIYEKLRNERKLSREAVSSMLMEQGIDLKPSRLGRIENEEFPITPREVLILSKVYGEPSLCNHYCANECDIGKKYVPEIKIKDLAHIVLEMLASLNSIETRQAQLIEITADGNVDDSEIKDFVSIQKDLERISVTVEAMQLWAEEMIAEGKIDIKKYNQIKNG